MNPQLTAPGQQVQPAPTSVTGQGVAKLAPIGAPTPSQLPTAPTNVGLPTPTQANLYNPSSDMQNIANYYNIPRQAAIASNAAQSAGEYGRQQFEHQAAEAGLTEQHLKDQLDSSKYHITQDPSSQYGVRITNSLGQQVNLGTYVNLTGQSPAEVLQNSTNPKAQQFVSDYNSFQQYLQNVQLASGGDKQAKQYVEQVNQAHQALTKIPANQIQQLFLQEYGEFFGMPQQQPMPQGNQFTNPNSLAALQQMYQAGLYSRMAGEYYGGNNISIPGQINPQKIVPNTLGQ